MTIADGVFFLTHDGGVALFRHEFPRADVRGRISIGDNVFIGVNVLLLPGVTVGDNVVIGAGAIVTRDVATGTVVAGNPARVVSSIADYRKKTIQRAGLDC